MSLWSTEETFQFLDLYRQESVIWNPKHPDHKNKNIVNDAWVRIEDAMGIASTELRKRKESLMTTFRLHLKKKKSSMRRGEEKVYKPIWTFYEVMEDFLKDIYMGKSIINSEEVLNVEDKSMQVDLETGYDNRLPLNEEPKFYQIESAPVLQGTKRRLKNYPQFGEVNTTMNKEFTALNDALTTRENEDECDLYGKLIAKKLRQFPEEERYELMYEIDGMILKRKSKANRLNVFNVQSASSSFFPSSPNSNSSSCANMELNYIEPATILTTDHDHIYNKICTDSNQNVNMYEKK